VADQVFNAMLDTVSANIGRIGLGFVLLISAGALRQGAFTIGDFALFVSYTAYASVGPQWIGRLLARRRTAAVSIGRLEEVLEGAAPYALSARRPAATTLADRADPLKVLAVRDLTSRYAGTDRGIEAVSFTL